MLIQKQTRKLLLASAIALASVASLGPVMAEDNTGDIMEARQETQIWTTFALSSHLKAHDLKVSVDDGVATLTGTVDDEVNKELAGQIALGVDGITKINNQIEVDADYTPVASGDERSFGEVVEDASISTAVKSKLLWSKHTQGLSAHVETLSGKVTLTGTANSDEARTHAGTLAHNTRGVTAVDNQLKVDTSKATVTEKAQDTTDDIGQSVSDGWITTKVKSTLAYSRNVDSTAISVSTEEGVVTLTGTVHSDAEKALATELANNIRGVVRVDNKGLTL